MGIASTKSLHSHIPRQVIYSNYMQIVFTEHCFSYRQGYGIQLARAWWRCYILLTKVYLVFNVSLFNKF